MRINVDLEKLYNKPNIKNMLYAKRLEWVGHTRRVDGKIIKKSSDKFFIRKMATWTTPVEIAGQN